MRWPNLVLVSQATKKLIKVIIEVILVQQYEIIPTKIYYFTRKISNTRELKELSSATEVNVTILCEKIIFK